MKKDREKALVQGIHSVIRGKIPPAPLYKRGVKKARAVPPLLKGDRGDLESQRYHDHRRRSSLPRVTERILFRKYSRSLPKKSTIFAGIFIFSLDIYVDPLA
jgi:hypothetical protein